MFGWLRKKKVSVPERSFEPSELSYPFAFPVLAIDEDGMSAHPSADAFGMTNDAHAQSGGLPATMFASVDGSVWRPSALLSMCRTGHRLFGREVVYGEFEYGRVGEWDLADLRAKAIAIIEQDDDIWCQQASHEEVLASVNGAKSFEELVVAIGEVGGQLAVRPSPTR